MNAAALTPEAMTSVRDRLQIVDPLDTPGWDGRVTSHPDYSFFHSAAWTQVLRGTYGFGPLYFTVSDRGRLLNLLPVMEVNSALTGRRGVSLPFTDECPVIASDSTSAGELLGEVLSCGKQLRWRYFECRGKGDLFPDVPASVSFYGHTLALADGEGSLFAGLDSSVRQAVRKAESAPVEVEITNSPESVRTFYHLHCQTRRKHGLPPQPFSFFENIHRSVLSRGMGVVAVGRHGPTPTAAAMFFHLGRKAIFKFGASDPAFQHLRGNNLVMWKAIQWYCRKGYALLDFGRTSLDNGGLRRFKLGFGTEERRVDYFKYDFRQGSFVADRDGPSGWATWVFHLLPLPVCRMMGQLLYRHWA